FATMLSPGMCLLILGLLGVAQGLITGDEGPPGTLPSKSPVYFPILPGDFKDFGIKATEEGGGGRGDSKRRGEGAGGGVGVGKSLDMPVTTPKPTTTTDRLPINPDGLQSHVASEVVTQPPGPSYLTDSYYYLKTTHRHQQGLKNRMKTLDTSGVFWIERRRTRICKCYNR
ncbi:hypothetical protein Pcinc_040633, partial [Petrolisthes cinctipes]